jgi:peptide/nickel transport system substrate-binding protein
MSHKVSRREFVKIAALSAAALAVPSAGRSSAAPAAGQINYAEAGDFSAFNPWRFEAVNTNMHNQLFDRLLWKDDRGRVQLQLAEAYEPARDGTSARVKLRQNAKWHDGKPIVAQDFVNMHNYTKDPDLQQRELGIRKTRDLLVPVREIVAVDQYTLQFNFNGQVPYFTEILDYLWAIRIDDPSDPAFMKRVPIGSGPFKFVHWVPNQYARFVRNPDYYMKGKPAIDTFMFRRLDRPETLVANLQSGAVHGIFVSNPADVQQLKSDRNITVVTTPHPGSIFPVMLNLKKPPMDKKQVRQALSYAMNRVEMAQKAFFGVSQPISTMFFSPASLGYREDLAKAYPFDLDRAAKLMEEAGVRNAEFHTIVTPRWPQMKLFTLIWQADLAKIGVKLNVAEVEQAQFLATGNDAGLKGLDMIPWVVGRTTRDPAIFFGTQITHRAGRTAKYGWQNDELEKLVAEGATETNTAKRRAIYQRANEIVVEEVPMIHVANDPRIWAWNNKVKGVTTDLVGDLTMVDATLQS